jgi:Bromodomain
MRAWFDDEMCNEHQYCIPVDLELFPDYLYKVICPMDLSLIRARLFNGWYRSTEVRPAPFPNTPKPKPSLLPLCLPH